jgi:putative membrane protein
MLMRLLRKNTYLSAAPLVFLSISGLVIGCAPGPPPPLVPMDISGWLFAAVICAAAIWVSLRVVRKPGHSPDRHDDRALLMLRERYARGEIDREDFLRRLRDLEFVPSASQGEHSS